MLHRSILLASASPRRLELLRQIGVEPAVYAPQVDERVQPGESPAAYVERIAREKAAVAAARFGDRVIVAADTAVVCDGLILGKPADRDDALAMLERLSGREHEVFSAVAVARRGRCLAALSVSRVRMRVIAPSEAMAYWATGEPRDKAGAYAIQGLAAVFIEALHGSYSGVMGLPLYETAQLLAEQGVELLAYNAQDRVGHDQ